jgi:hypothetical protein
LEGVNVTLDEADLTDRIIRVNCDYTKNLFLRLGKALDPHLEVAKSHAASMKEAALAWQEKAIKSINDTTAALQKDNKRVIRDNKSEASQETKELKKQLEALNKKHTDLQTEFSFTSAALTLKNKMEIPKDVNSDTLNITELTRELGDQRKHNEELEKQLHELLESFSNYKAGHLREQLDTDLKDNKDFKKESHIKGDFNHDSRRPHSPGWGKVHDSRRTLGGDLLAVAVMENQGPSHEMMLGLRNLSPGVEIETVLGMERGVHLLQGTPSRPTKGCHRRKNGCRKVDWEHLNGKEMTKFEPI